MVFLFSNRNGRNKKTMNISKKQQRWLIVLAGFLLSGVNVGINTNCNTAFLNPVCEDLGISLSNFALTASIVSFVSIPCLLAIPQLLKKMSARSLLIFSGVGFILFKVLFGCSQELWQFYACSVGIGIFAPGFGYLTVNSIINRTFTENNGLAVGIASSGAGIVGAVALPVVTWMISAKGWRSGYYLEAVLALLFIGFAVILIGGEKKETQEENVSHSSRWKMSGQEKIAFLLLLVGLFLLCLVGMGIQPYLMPYMKSIGYTTAFAAGVVSGILTINTVAKIISGYVFDRVGATGAAVITVGTMIASLLLLMLLKGSPAVYLFAFIFSFAYVALSIPAPFFTRQLFGEEHFTELYSIVMIITSVGGAVGNTLTGLLLEQSGSYIFVWVCYISLVIAAAGCLSAAILVKKREG